MGVNQARKIGHSGPLRIAIADDSGLIYSDDYRHGWPWGFRSLGCEVKAFDISMLRRIGMIARSPYSTSGLRGAGKLIGQNIASWKPDLVWCHHGRAAGNGLFLDKFRKLGIPTAVYLCDEPYETGETARYSPGFDFVFTMDPCTTEIHRMSRNGRANTYYLPPGVHTDLFQQQSYRNRDIPAFFLGNADLPPRLDWLVPVEKVIEGTDIRFFPHRQRPRGAVHKNHPLWIPAEDNPKWYARAVVGLNVHRAPEISPECFKRRITGRPRALAVPAGLTLCAAAPSKWGTGFWNDGNTPAAHVNPRFLEMAACGTLVVSDDMRPELARMFPMAPRASDPAHFLELVSYYINHRDEAQAIGEVCSFLISRRHTYRHRAAEVLIRVGLKVSDAEDLVTLLGEPQEWLTPQDFNAQGERLSSAPTGLSERWSPQYGLSLISKSGSVKGTSSLDVPSGWWSS